MISAWVALFLLAPQDLKQPPEILKDPAAHGIGKEIESALFAKHLKNSRLLVVAYAATECPISKVYRPRLDRLAEQYRSKGVSFLYVHCNYDDPPRKGKRAVPAVHDRTGKLTALLGATRTTDAFVLDAKRILRYRGALDDQYGIGYTRDRPTRTYLMDALEALLAGKTPSVEATKAPGCAIESRPVAAAGATVTFHRDVAPILNRRCVECHRPGEIGPFPLLTYERARSKAKSIKLAVSERRMPPWFASPEHGAFANDRRLTKVEIDTLVRWADTGAAEGDRKDAPPAPEFPEGWVIGKPDAVWKIPRPFRVPAEGTIPYKYSFVQTRLKEDKWVRAIEIRPGVREVVHHILVFVRYPLKRLREQPRIDGGLFYGYFGVMVPGERPMIYPEGQGKVLPAGSVLIFQIHYTAIGKEHEDRTSVGMKFWDKPPENEILTRGIVNKRIRIPPGAADHREDARFTLRHGARILGFLPHMHVRGKSFRYVAEYPDGREEILLDVPKYDFNWQLFYRLKEPKRVPEGTKIRAIARYDNSKDNPANPDPSAQVRFGDQTWDEMLIGYMDFIKD